MIKLIVFDMDGVLVDSKELHFESLNSALIKYNFEPITKEEHLVHFDGLSTKQKLDKLFKLNRIGKESWMIEQINDEKQYITRSMILKLEPDYIKCNMLNALKLLGYKIYVASNAIRDTVKLLLIKKGLLASIDYFYSNEDVKNPKPNPEMYLQSMIRAGVGPKETLIIEDSVKGREAAINSCAHICTVEKSSDTTFERITNRIYEINKVNISTKWIGKNMNILIPMAGAGSRFEKAGYTFPKPLIEINNEPMIKVVVDNLNIDANYIFIVQKKHYDQYNLKYLLNLISHDCKIIQVDGITEGAACTTLLAKEFINNNEHLIIANSDQFIKWNSSDFLYSVTSSNIDASILTFNSTHPKWSYVKLGKDGFVSEVAEKKPISNLASVGIYYWNKGSDYVKYAEQMISKNIRVNNEFYVCPVFNEAILDDNKKIKTYDVEEMFGLGTPEDLDEFKRKYLNQ
jgi:HAD superfamily hydrolase (TIGR01509 family)